MNFPLSSSERRGSSWGWSLTIPSLRRVSCRKTDHSRWSQAVECDYNRLSTLRWIPLCEQWRITRPTFLPGGSPLCKVSIPFLPPLRLCGSFLNSFFGPNMGRRFFPPTVVFTISFSKTIRALNCDWTNLTLNIGWTWPPRRCHETQNNFPSFYLSCF